MVNVNINGVSYQIPNTGEEGWGDNVTNWIVAASSFLLQRSGGSFPLSAEANFGNVAGLRALIYRSQASDVAASGVLRLGNGDKIGFRNAANSADLQLGLTGDAIEFNSIPLLQAGLGSIVNADVNAAAAIALSKLAAVTASRALVSDSSGVIVPSAVTATELGYLSGATSNIQGQINALVVGAGINQLTGDVTAGPGSGSQAATIATGAVTTAKIANLAVDNSKLAALAVDNSKVSNTAAIAYSKLALTGSVVAADQNSGAAPDKAILTANGSGGASYQRFIAFKGRVAGGASYPDIPNEVPITIVDYDTDSAFNTGTFTYTVPTGGAGYYSLTIQVAASSTTSAITTVAAAAVNGTFAPLYINAQYLNGSSYNPGAIYTTTLLVADGDEITFNSWLNSTGFTYNSAATVCTLERLR